MSRARDGPSARCVQVYLLSADTGAGKTTTLLEWIQTCRAEKVTVAGVLSPIGDADGRRYVQLASNDERRLLQLNDVTEGDKHAVAERKAVPSAARGPELESADARAQAAASAEDAVSVGPFVFSQAVLRWGQEEISRGLGADVEWIIVDEVGPLEVRRNSGWEPAVGAALRARKEHPRTKFVIVVRPSLKAELMSHYGIADDEAVDFQEYLDFAL